MTTEARSSSTTLPLEEFWSWLCAHPNCVVRAGTPNAVLYDHPDLHWHFGDDEEGNFLVQIIRGKEMLAEMIISPTDVLYVMATPAEEEQFLFEMIMGPSAEEGFASYHFLMSHAFDEGTPEERRWAH